MNEMKGDYLKYYATHAFKYSLKPKTFTLNPDETLKAC